MARKRYAIPQYGTVIMAGKEYYRTRIEDADGKRVALYGRTREELYDKVLEAREQIEDNTFRRSSPTVKEYCEKWLLLQSAQVRATTLTDYTSKVNRHIIKPLGHMNIADFLQNEGNKRGFSFEVLPPLKGNGTAALFRTIDSLKDYAPRFINITTHHSEYVYKELENGLLSRQRVRRRPGTVAIAAAIQNKYDIPVIPHVICSGVSKEDIEYELLDLQHLDAVLAGGGEGDHGVAGAEVDADGVARRHARGLRPRRCRARRTAPSSARCRPPAGPRARACRPR